MPNVLNGPEHARSSRVIFSALLSLCAVSLMACGASDDDDPGCLGPGGPYQRGKEPYPGANAGLVCCDGLSTYYRALSSSDGSCVEPIIANFSCVQGLCGDGMCEAGEQGACGCDVDCEE